MPIQQHDITYFELDFPNLKNINSRFPNPGNDKVSYSVLNTLFIGDKLFGLVSVEKKRANTTNNYYYTSLYTRLYLVNMRTKQPSSYIEYLDGRGGIKIADRLVIHQTRDVLSSQTAKTNEYTVYAITNSAKLEKIKEFSLPADTIYGYEGNTFLYLDAKNNFAGFKYFPDTNTCLDLYAENPLMNSLGADDSGAPIINKDWLPFDINSFTVDDKYGYIILDYKRDNLEYNSGMQLYYLFDTREWPPKFIKEYRARDIIPCFNGNYFNNYIGRDNKPLTILSVFPELTSGLSDKDIVQKVLEFQQVKQFCVGESDNTRLTYEIVMVDDTTVDEDHPRLPICGYDITVSAPARFKITNTYLGHGQIVGDAIFRLVEDEYRRTLTRFRVAKDYFTCRELRKFIHPFGRLIYSQTCKDGILALNHNRTKYKNIIQGFYVFVVLPDKAAREDTVAGTKQPSFRIKIIGYYPHSVGGINKCNETGEEFVYKSEYYDREQTHTNSLTCFYGTYVSRMRAKFDRAQLGYTHDFLLDNISKFYVINRYRMDIGRINSRNSLVPLLKL